VASLVEGGQSGRLRPIDRPDLDAVLTALRSNPRIDGVIVASLDRVARALDVGEEILNTLWRIGKDVYTADDGLIQRDDPDNPNIKLVRRLKWVVAEYEADIIAKRLRHGRVAAKAAGRKGEGVYAFGYEGSGEKSQRVSVPNPQEQATIRHMRALRAAGYSYRAICAQLNQEGYKPRGATTWRPNTVMTILKREAPGRIANAPAPDPHVNKR
jgi:site-specific DNA recombinase